MRELTQDFCFNFTLVVAASEISVCLYMYLAFRRVVEVLECDLLMRFDDSLDAIDGYVNAFIIRLESAVDVESAPHEVVLIRACEHRQFVDQRFALACCNEP